MALNGWNLGLDNVRIGQRVPETGPGVIFPVALLLFVLAQRAGDLFFGADRIRSSR